MTERLRSQPGDKKARQQEDQPITGSYYPCQAGTADAEAKAAVERLSDMDLSELFIVSACLIRDDAGEGETAASGASSQIPGLNISVVEAPGVKCPRCWKHFVDADPETGLCPRCASVVAKL